MPQRFVRDATRRQHRLGRVLLRDGRLRRARCYELHDRVNVPLRRGQSRPRGARESLRELYVGESVSAFTSANSVADSDADSDADSVAHCRGALVVVRLVVVRKAGDSGRCLDGDPRCWYLCMCWSDVTLLWTNLPGVMGFERPLRISLLNLARLGRRLRGQSRRPLLRLRLLRRVVRAVTELQEQVATEEPAGKGRSTIDRRRRRLRRLGADDGRDWLRRRHWCEGCCKCKDSAGEQGSHVYAVSSQYW